MVLRSWGKPTGSLNCSLQTPDQSNKVCTSHRRGACFTTRRISKIKTDLEDFTLLLENQNGSLSGSPGNLSGKIPWLILAKPEMKTRPGFVEQNDIVLIWMKTNAVKVELDFDWFDNPKKGPGVTRRRKIQCWKIDSFLIHWKARYFWNLRCTGPWQGSACEIWRDWPPLIEHQTGHLWHKFYLKQGNYQTLHYL